MTAQVYVNQIVKKVKCSGKKRKEIHRQLLADIQTEIGQGVPLDVIMLRMGEPIAIAEEFNQNLSQQEYRKYKSGSRHFGCHSGTYYNRRMVFVYRTPIWNQRTIYTSGSRGSQQGGHPSAGRRGLRGPAGRRSRPYAEYSDRRNNWPGKKTGGHGLGRISGIWEMLSVGTVDPRKDKSRGTDQCCL